MSFILNKANDLVVTPWGVFIDDKAYDLDTLQEIEGLSFPHSVPVGYFLIGARSIFPYQNVNLNSYLICDKLDAIAYNTNTFNTAVCFIEDNKLHISNNSHDFYNNKDLPSHLEGFPFYEDDRGIWIVSGKYVYLISKISKQGKISTTSICDYRLEQCFSAGENYINVRFLTIKNGFLYIVANQSTSPYGTVLKKIDLSLQTNSTLRQLSSNTEYYPLYSTGYDINDENSYLTCKFSGSSGSSDVLIYQIEPDFSGITYIKTITLPTGYRPSNADNYSNEVLQHIIITHDVSNEKNYYTFMSIQNTSSPSRTLNKVICVDDSDNVIFEETDVKHCIKIEKDKFLIGNGYDIKLIKWSSALENWTMTSFNVGTSYNEFFLDFTGKIWVLSTDGSTFYRIAPKQGVTLVSTFEKENYGYMGDVINSYVDLTCSDIEGLRVTVSQNVQLNGPVTFADGSKQKVINLDKNNTVRVPIKIVGHGPISCQLSF